MVSDHNYRQVLKETEVSLAELQNRVRESETVISFLKGRLSVVSAAETKTGVDGPYRGLDLRSAVLAVLETTHPLHVDAIIENLVAGGYRLNSGAKPTAGSVQSCCRRNAKMFVKTAPSTFDLRGASTEETSKVKEA